jgi:hypothetical protein
MSMERGGFDLEGGLSYDFLEYYFTNHAESRGGGLDFNF